MFPFLSFSRTELMMNGLKTMTAAVLVASLGTAAQAGTIYAQTFSDVVNPVVEDVEVPTLLDDTAVQVGTGTWQAGSLFETDGTISTVARSSAILAFNPEAGKIYTLSANVSLTNAGFLGMGFANETSFTGNSGGQNNNNAYRFVGVSGTTQTVGEGWLMINGTSNLVNPYGSSITAASDATAIAYSATDPVLQLKVTLDTTDLTNWVTTYYVDNVSLGTDTRSAATLDALIDSVGFASGNGAGTISNFSLTEVPEPGSLALLGLGGLAIMSRRRRA